MKPSLFACEIDGDYMQPTLTGGDYVLFRPVEEGEVLTDCLCVIQCGGREDAPPALAVRRLLLTPAGVALRRDNPRYEPVESVVGSEEAFLPVVGVVVWTMRRTRVDAPLPFNRVGLQLPN